ncbi:choice-of-anchor I family protein [Anaerostipes faecalis]|uniref:choice-of-anchor I family protein n=1 Tax=Anaerostipes faecalis TaxID=2738446 RepID=UPI003F01B4DC
MKKFNTKFLSFGLSLALMSQGVGANMVLAADQVKQPVVQTQSYAKQAAATHLIINQVYGGNGKGETPISNSFIELYNPTSQDISLKGYTLSFDEATSLELPDVTLKAGASWLIICKPETTTDEFLTYDLPEADQNWDIAINNKNYTLTLKNSQGVVDSATADEKVDDIKVSKQKSLRRVNYVDTDTNDDWDVIVWEKSSVTVNDEYVQNYAPRNSKGEYGKVHSAEAAPEQPVYTPVVTSDEKITGVNNGATPLNMQLFARYNSGAMNADGGSLEIVEYNEKNGYAYAVSGLKGQVIAVKITGIEDSEKVASLSGQEYDVKTLVETVAAEAGFKYGDITSVAISPDGTKLAAAVQHADYDKCGKIAVFTCEKDGSLKNPKLYDAGVQPDMVTFANANTVLTADEGEPRNGYNAGNTDPAGSVTILNLSDGTSVQAGFDKYSAEDLIAKNILIGKANDKMLDPKTDLEPEYIAVSADGKKAYVSLQEANAIAELDVDKKEFTGIYSTGFEDYSKVAVDLVEDDKYEAKTYAGLVGARMPDGIAVYENAGKTYVVTANEGDSRDWTNYLNEAKTDAFTGKKIRVIDDTKCAGLPEGKKVMFGGRSFSIFEVTENGLTEVYDSGNEFESNTAKTFGDYFNCSNDDNDIDSRSPKKGPEPENVTVGKINGKAYAFVAVERIGGIMAYDITDPQNSIYANYINSRDFSEAIKGDVSPEGLCVAQADGKNILLAACEVSGTLAAYELPKTEVEPPKTEEEQPEKPAPQVPKKITATLKGNGGKTVAVIKDAKAGAKLPSWNKAKFKVAGKKGYAFAGWTYKGKTVTKMPSSDQNIVLTAKFVKMSVGQAKVLNVKGKYGKGTGFEATSRKYTKEDGSRRGFRFCYAVNSKMKYAKYKTTGLTKNTYTKTGLTRGKKYYVQVRYYYYDSTNQRVYGAYSTAKSVKAF